MQNFSLLQNMTAGAVAGIAVCLPFCRQMFWRHAES